MQIALAEAHSGAAAGEVPVGAVLIGADGKELARGHNAPRKLCDPTAHAEVLTLRRAAQRAGAYRLPGTTLYATLEPCALCMGAALQARVGRIVFESTFIEAIIHNMSAAGFELAVGRGTQSKSSRQSQRPPTPES